MAPGQRFGFTQFGLRQFALLAVASLLVLAGTLGSVLRAHAMSTHSGPSATQRASLLLGNRRLERTLDSEPSGRGEAFPFHVSRAGIAGGAVVYLESATTARSLRVAVYANRAGNPGSLMTSGVAQHPAGGRWTPVRLARARLRGRRTYWIALLGLGGRIAFRDRANAACTSQEEAHRLARFPVAWVPGHRWRTCRLSAYIISSSPVTHKPTPKPKPNPTPPPTATPAPTAAPSPTQKNCIANPAACGYPDPTNTGVPAGVALTPRSGDMVITQAGATISGIDLSGTIEIMANNVTIKDSRITNADTSGHAIFIGPGVSGTIIEDSTLRGVDATSGSLAAGIQNAGSSDTKAIRLYAYNVDSAFHGPGDIEDSYFLDNAQIPNEHYEPIFYAGGGGPLIVNHDTLLNPHEQTACVFAWTNEGPEIGLRITNNLMAGGGYVIYAGSADPSTRDVTITGNRFSNVYFRHGGQYGVDTYVNPSVTTWSGNYWDATLAPIQR